MTLAVFFGLAIAIILVLISVSIAAAFGLGSILIAFLSDVNIQATFSTMFSRINDSSLIALPLFIYLGVLAERSGQGARLVDFVQLFVGRIKGGLGIVIVFSCALFGAVSGAGSAAIASIGGVMMPRAQAAGYPRGYLVALVACSSTLTLLIPPSIPMLIFALTLQISVAGAFMTTLLPGIIIAIGYSILNIFICRKFPITVTNDEADTNENIFIYRGKRAFWVAFVPIIVLGSIYGGYASPTEAAGIGAIYVALLGIFIYRSMSLQEFFRATVGSAELLGSLVFMISALLLFSVVLVYQGAPFTLAKLISGHLTVWQGLIVLNIILFIMGMIMDDISGAIVAASVLYPVAQHLNIDPFQFAAIVAINLGLGNVTPPVAPLLFLSSAVAGNVPMHQYVGYVAKFLLFVKLPVLLLVTYIPEFSLFIPRLLGYG